VQALVCVALRDGIGVLPQDDTARARLRGWMLLARGCAEAGGGSFADDLLRTSGSAISTPRCRHSPSQAADFGFRPISDIRQLRSGTEKRTFCALLSPANA